MAKSSSSPSIIYSHQRICYRCHLTFQTNSIANLHTELSGHPTCNSGDKIMIDRCNKLLKKQLIVHSKRRTASWKHDDQTKEYNTNFTNVMEIDSLLRGLIGALNRRESRVFFAQARIEYSVHSLK